MQRVRRIQEIMIDVLIVEDDSNVRKLLKKMIEKHDGFSVSFEASGVKEAIEFYQNNPVELVMMDIDLKGESGMECARIISDMNPKVKIVFTTAHSEYMADAFEIYAFDYIVKPYNMQRLNRTLNRIKDISYNNENTHNTESHMPVTGSTTFGKLTVKNKEETFFIDFEDIYFIERVNGSTRIITDSREYITSMSLSDIYEKLDKNIFLRSHRSYIVNMIKIHKITQYGRWTYNVKFKGISESALMTYENFEAMKRLYGG